MATEPTSDNELVLILLQKKKIGVHVDKILRQKKRLLFHTQTFIFDVKEQIPLQNGLKNNKNKLHYVIHTTAFLRTLVWVCI